MPATPGQECRRLPIPPRHVAEAEQAFTPVTLPPAPAIDQPVPG